MEMWKNMKIPGNIWAPVLTGALLGITMGLFISLPVSRQEENTSVGSISTKNESLELTVKMGESGEELHLKVTGANTTEAVRSLQMMLKNMDILLL